MSPHVKQVFIKSWHYEKHDNYRSPKWLLATKKWNRSDRNLDIFIPEWFLTWQTYLFVYLDIFHCSSAASLRIILTAYDFIVWQLCSDRNSGPEELLCSVILVKCTCFQIFVPSLIQWWHLLLSDVTVLPTNQSMMCVFFSFVITWDY